MRKNEQTIKEAINELLEAYRLKDKLNETRLLKSWEHITGKMISNHTVDLFIKRKILYVKLDSPALKNELTFAKDKILKLLNEEAGQEVIVKIVFI